MQICKEHRVPIEHEHLTKVLLYSNCMKCNWSLEEVSRNLIWILHRHGAVITHPKITRKATPQPQSQPPTPQQSYPSSAVAVDTEQLHMSCPLGHRL